MGSLDFDSVDVEFMVVALVCSKFCVVRHQIID
jgi:hypothetical protein